MIIQIREKLKNLGDKNKAEIIKKYLKSDYAFYGLKVPELRKIAKELKNLEFYDALNLFEELWNSGNHEEMSLALYFIHNYRKKYPIELWKFLIQRVEKAKSWDHIDELGMHTLGEILAENIPLVQEVKALSASKNHWMRRLSLVANYPLIKKNKLDLIFLLAEKLIYDENEYVQKGAGWMLREAGKRNRLAVREFILMHMDMQNTAFSYATEKMKELREIRKEKILDKDKLIKRFEELDYDKIKELLTKLNINFKGEILNVKKQDILNKILEIKNKEEIMQELK